MGIVNSNEVDINEIFHKLWGKAVDTDGYDRKEWTDLQQHITRLNRIERAVLDSIVT